MDGTAWTVIGMGVTILLAIGTSHWNLQARFDRQSEQMSLLREGMAHLEGLLEGLREAISGKRVA